MLAWIAFNLIDRSAAWIWGFAGATSRAAACWQRRDARELARMLIEAAGHLDACGW